jgi:phage major head subunit gpT-like protein
MTMTLSPTQLPDQLSFTCPLTIEAAGEKTASGGGIPQFRMVAYTGGLMRIEGFPHPVVVDLEGLGIDRQDIPVRLDHNSRQGVGHTQRVAVENGSLIAEGLVSRDTSWARDVIRSGQNGFPWQASIGAAVIDAQFIPNGQNVTVNGRTFDGPIHVVRKAVLKEISFVDNGADSSTSARIAANSKEQSSMPHGTQNQATTTVVTDPKPATPSTINTPTPEDPTPPPSPARPATLAARAMEDVSDAQRPDDQNPMMQMRRQMAEETRRIQAIRSTCAGKHPDIEAQAIEEGWDVTKTELHVLRASRPQVPVAIRGTGQSSRPSNPQVFEAVALMASGLPSSRVQALYAEPVLEAADKLRGIGVQEFCEMASGQQLPRFRRDATGWLQAAFSSASLPGVLSNIANKMLLEGYNYVEDAWRRIAKIASVNDFKEHTRYRMTGSFKFQQVGPDGEIKHGQLDEQQFGQKADTHGIMFALTRQMIINDDLGAFTDIPRQIGMGAAEAIAEAVWALWLSNPVQSDGKAFFHADHNNYSEGADTALSIDGLTAAEILFAQQVKPNGKPLGIMPSLLLVPPGLKVAAEMLMKSLQLNETTTTNKPKPSTNPHAGKFDVVSSVYLSNTSFTNASNKAWYLLADPNRLSAIEVAFLNGVDRPTVEKTDADFSTLGVQFRGYIDFGVREQDHRGAVKLKGEA